MGLIQISCEIIPNTSVWLLQIQDTFTRNWSKNFPKKGTKYDVYGLVINEPYSDLTFFDTKNSDYVYYSVQDSDGNNHARIVNYKTNDTASSFSFALC